MRALRFGGWFVASLVVPGIALWRSGHRGAAGVVASTTALPTILAFASLRWPSLGLGLFVTGMAQGITVLIAAGWGAARASRESVEKWPTTTIFALAMLLSSVPLRVWRERWSESFKEPSESMQPSLLVGDHFFVRRPATPSRGAVVVFPVEQRGGIFFVKRIVGLPGDTVSWRGAALSINGTPVPTDACPEPSPECRTESLDGKRWQVLPGSHPRLDGEWKVPPDHVFVLGDNRDNSEDSRLLGSIPIAVLKGTATYIHFSWPNLSRSGRPIDPE